MILVFALYQLTVFFKCNTNLLTIDEKKFSKSEASNSLQYFTGKVKLNKISPNNVVSFIRLHRETISFNQFYNDNIKINLGFHSR